MEYSWEASWQAIERLEPIATEASWRGIFRIRHTAEVLAIKVAKEWDDGRRGKDDRGRVEDGVHQRDKEECGIRCSQSGNLLPRA